MIILASASPRRKDILRLSGIKFTVCPADIKEYVSPGLSPDKVVEQISKQKATSVAASHPHMTVLAADTVVSVDGRIIGKPASASDAFETLSLLSGREHTVLTGFTIIKGERAYTDHESTRVFFKALTENEINGYINTGEPFDKAGSYGIQGAACAFVRRIEGDFFNVIGLPICKVKTVLESFFG